MNLKFLFPLLGLALGIFFSDVIDGGVWLPAIFIGAALLLWIIVNRLSKNPTLGLRLAKLHYVWIALLFFGIGAIDFNIFGKSSIYSEIHNHKCYFIGEIKDIKTLVDGDRFNVKIISIHDSLGQPIDLRNVNILLKTDGYIGKKGDKISFFSKASKFRDSLYAERMKHQGILYFANAKSDAINKIGKASSINLFFDQIRQNIIIQIEKSKLDRPTSEFLSSTLLGDKTLMAPEVRQTLTSAGLAHILALSGLHVAIIYSLILILLFPLSLLGLHKFIKIAGLTLIWIYVLLTGCAPSTVRAAFMLTTILIAYILERKKSSLNALFAAVLLILVIDPLALWNIGLQLSFLCVAAILIFTNKLNPVHHHEHPRLYKTINVLLISLITTFSSWVVIAYYFKSVPLLFLPANFLLLPLLPLYIGTGAIYLILLVAGWDCGLLADLLNIFYSLFLGATVILSFNNGASIEMDIPPIAVTLWLLGTLFIALALYTSRLLIRKFNYTASILFLSFSIFTILIYDKADEKSLRFIHSFNKIEARVNINGNKANYQFPVKSISHLSTEHFRISAIDNALLPDSLETIKEKTGVMGKPSYLIIGSNADPVQMAQLIGVTSFDKVILHATISENKKTELLRLIDESLWPNIYSLRENGSLEFEF